jgi:hypothetical protein
MKYVCLFGYVAGFALIGHSWLADLPIRFKIGLSALGVVLILVAFAVQWFVAKK